MAKGGSQSQAATSAGAGGRPSGAVPRGTPAAAAGLRRRRISGGGFAGSGPGSGPGSGSNVLRFYTDDAPGLKMSPTMVLAMSLCFIGFVTALHVFGKLYRHRSGGS